METRTAAQDFETANAISLFVRNEGPKPEFQMTTYLRQKFIAGLAETDRLIAKESRYSAYLQKAEYLADLKAHAAKMLELLEMTTCATCQARHAITDTDFHAAYHANQ